MMWPVATSRGRKQRRRAMALVIVGERAGAPALQREAWLGAIQGLDLALLIQREDDRPLGRLQVQPDGGVFPRRRGRRQLERPDPVGAQPWALMAQSWSDGNGTSAISRSRAAARRRRRVMAATFRASRASARTRTGGFGRETPTSRSSPSPPRQTRAQCARARPRVGGSCGIGPAIRGARGPRGAVATNG